MEGNEEPKRKKNRDSSTIRERRREEGRERGEKSLRKNWTGRERETGGYLSIHDSRDSPGG